MLKHEEWNEGRRQKDRSRGSVGEEKQERLLTKKYSSKKKKKK